MICCILHTTQHFFLFRLKRQTTLYVCKTLHNHIGIKAPAHHLVQQALQTNHSPPLPSNFNYKMHLAN